MAERGREGEQVLLRLKPAWRSFFVHYAAAGFLVAVALKDAFLPEAGRPFPLGPAPTLVLAAALLLYVVLKRQATEFVVTTRRAQRHSGLGLSRDLELARIDELRVYQTLVIQRLLRTGKIIMADSHDLTSRIQFFGVEEPMRVKETIARLISEARSEGGR
jgi:hypothetical protein